MLIILVLVAAVLAGAVLLYFESRPGIRGGYDFPHGLLVTLIAGLGLVGALISLPIVRAQDGSLIQQYYADKASIANARMAGASDVERATIFQTIQQDNGILAEKKYYNGSLWFDWFIVDELAELPPLR